MACCEVVDARRTSIPISNSSKQYDLDQEQYELHQDQGAAHLEHIEEEVAGSVGGVHVQRVRSLRPRVEVEDSEVAGVLGQDRTHKRGGQE